MSRGITQAHLLASDPRTPIATAGATAHLIDLVNLIGHRTGHLTGRTEKTTQIQRREPGSAVPGQHRGDGHPGQAPAQSSPGHPDQPQHDQQAHTENRDNTPAAEFDHRMSLPT